MMEHIHSKTVCKRCGTTVSSCRCFHPVKATTYVDSCDKCKNTIMSTETPEAQRSRIANDLGRYIADLEASPRSKRLLGVIVFDMLVDARVKIENYERAANKA